ncbi:hypothetical protein, partial [Propionicicella superfundia]|uniref:hypothetical protein n=1 Tax=Propionicicella superfundia TaxID=348582 RepID=UPI00048AC966
HIYIGHTFMNPSYRPMTDYVWITRYTPATGRTETFDIGTEAGIGVNAITTTDDTLYILGTGTDEEQVTLLTYNLPDMTERSRTTIHRPTGYGHRYPAGLIVP